MCCSHSVFSYPEQNRAPGVASVRHFPQMMVCDLDEDEDDEEDDDDAGDFGRDGGGAGAGRCDGLFSCLGLGWLRGGGPVSPIPCGLTGALREKSRLGAGRAPFLLGLTSGADDDDDDEDEPPLRLSHSSLERSAFWPATRSPGPPPTLPHRTGLSEHTCK